MSALSCQLSWWSWPVELLTCVYWTRLPARCPGKTPRFAPFTFLFPSFLPCFCLRPSIYLSVLLASPPSILKHFDSAIIFYFFKVIILPSYSFVSFFFSPRLLLFSFSLTLLSIFSLYYFFFFGLHCSLVQNCAPSPWAAVFISFLHLAEHAHEHAAAVARKPIETCVSKLLMLTEALYCR